MGTCCESNTNRYQHVQKIRTNKKSNMLTDDEWTKYYTETENMKNTSVIMLNKLESSSSK